MTDITPRTNTELFGHSAAEALLLEGFRGGKLAHGWLISGPEGVGKATLAYRFARTLLSSPSPLAGEGRDGGYFPHAQSVDGTPHPNPPPQGGRDYTDRRIAAGSHTDLLVVEPLFDDKKGEFARTITVEQARGIGEFLSLTPGEGAWRVVIVDSIDALNGNAANAILKILEEPPEQAILMLISHNPGRLLPTIRSRCRSLRLAPLTLAQFSAVMRRVAPSIDSEQMKALGEISGYSPGVAISLHAQDALETYAEILDLVSTLPAIDLTSIHGFSDSLTGAQVHERWQLLERLVAFLLERIAKEAAQAGVTPISDEEGDVLRNLSRLHPPSVWAEKWQAALEQFSVAQRLHLDYKQVIIAFFHSLAVREGFQTGTAA